MNMKWNKIIFSTMLCLSLAQHQQTFTAATLGLNLARHQQTFTATTAVAQPGFFANASAKIGSLCTNATKALTTNFIVKTGSKFFSVVKNNPTSTALAAVCTYLLYRNIKLWYEAQLSKEYQRGLKDKNGSIVINR